MTDDPLDGCWTACDFHVRRGFDPPSNRYGGICTNCAIATALAYGRKLLSGDGPMTEAWTFLFEQHLAEYNAAISVTDAIGGKDWRKVEAKKHDLVEFIRVTTVAYGRRIAQECAEICHKAGEHHNFTTGEGEIRARFSTPKSCRPADIPRLAKPVSKKSIQK